MSRKGCSPRLWPITKRCGQPFRIRRILPRAYILGRSGQITEAHAAIHQLVESEKTSPVDPIAFAQAFAGIGDKDHALAWLEKAYAQHSNGLTSLKVDPAYDRLRGDQRFRDLLRRVGLEP